MGHDAGVAEHLANISQVVAVQAIEHPLDKPVGSIPVRLQQVHGLRGQQQELYITRHLSRRRGITHKATTLPHSQTYSNDGYQQSRRPAHRGYRGESRTAEISAAQG